MREITKTVYTFGELLKLHQQKEVSESVVDRVRQQLAEFATDHGWWESVYEIWQQALGQIGFLGPEIAFSGFWSQGDGASFTCQHVEVEKLIDFLATKVEPSECVQPTARTGDQEDFWPWLAHKAGGKPYNPKYRHLLRVQDYLDDVKVERIDSHYVHWNTCRFRLTLRDRGDFDHSQPKDRYGWHPWKSRTPRLYGLAEAFREAVEQLRQDLCKAIYKDLEEEYEYRTADEQLVEDCDANGWHFDASGSME